MSIQWMQRMRDAGLSQEQAEVIASMPEERYVTREYFDAHMDANRVHLDAGLSATRDYVDARISQLESSLTWRIIGIIGVAIVLVGLIDKFVRP